MVWPYIVYRQVNAKLFCGAWFIWRHRHWWYPIQLAWFNLLCGLPGFSGMCKIGKGNATFKRLTFALLLLASQSIPSSAFTDIKIPRRRPGIMGCKLGVHGNCKGLFPAGWASVLVRLFRGINVSCHLFINQHLLSPNGASDLVWYHVYRQFCCNNYRRRYWIWHW